MIAPANADEGGISNDCKEADALLQITRSVRVTEKLKAEWALPKQVRVENGADVISPPSLIGAKSVASWWCEYGASRNKSNFQTVAAVRYAMSLWAPFCPSS